MDELERIRTEYARRKDDPRYHKRYSRFSQADIFLLQERDREILRLFAESGCEDWSTARVLEVGCGDGHQIAKFISYGLDARNLFGLDLLQLRAQGARSRYSNLQFICGDAGSLPFQDKVFDLMFQFTVFTSVLDATLRHRIAKEMLRTLKNDGLILWYDYRLNPTNPQTRGIEKAEIKRLFPDCVYTFRRITLAPPLARWVAPRSWIVCALLSQLSFLKTHYLAVIRKDQDETRF